MDLTISKSQERACRLLGIEHNGSYSSAAKALEAAGAFGDGLPMGETWRSAAKLSDADLTAKLVDSRRAYDDARSVETLREAYGE